MGKSEHKKRHRDDDSSDDGDRDKTKSRDSGRPHISDADFFKRNAEFSVWLKESRGVVFGELDGDKARSHFSKFVRRWNSGRLSDKYYGGIEGRLDASVRTGHKWSFASKLNTAEMDAVRDAVDGATYRSSKGAAGSAGAPQKASGDRAVTRGYAADVGPAPPRHSSASMAPALPPGMRDKKAERKADKEYSDYKEMVLEELVPKPTGREVVVERRAMRRVAKRDGELSPELHDSVVLGTDELDKDNIARDRALAREATQRARRQAEGRTKLEEHRVRENAKMDELRQLASMRQWTTHQK